VGVNGLRNGISAATLDVKWVKSVKSAGAGQCVELAPLPEGRVAFRNSTDPTGPALVFEASEFDAFLDGVKKNEFDHLCAS
jgi:predicted secreted Zn-dependent protease